MANKPQIKNTSQHAFIIGPKPKSERKKGERRAPIVVHAADAKAADGSDPSVVELDAADHKRLKDCFVLQEVAKAGIGLEVA